MITFDYHDEENGISIVIPYNDNSDGAQLSYLFAHFVELTRMLGYYAGSWAEIFQDIYYCSTKYDIYDWASDVLADYRYEKNHS